MGSRFKVLQKNVIVSYLGKRKVSLKIGSSLRVIKVALRLVGHRGSRLVVWEVEKNPLKAIKTWANKKNYATNSNHKFPTKNQNAKGKLTFVPPKYRKYQ